MKTIEFYVKTIFFLNSIRIRNPNNCQKIILNKTFHTLDSFYHNSEDIYFTQKIKNWFLTKTLNKNKFIKKLLKKNKI